MAKTRTKSSGDKTPVTGGVKVPARLLATPAGGDDAPDDDLGRTAYWLLKMHPKAVSLKFRKSDLSAMDDETKRALIADIQHALGVAPLKGDVL